MLRVIPPVSLDKSLHGIDGTPNFRGKTGQSLLQRTEIPRASRNAFAVEAFKERNENAPRRSRHLAEVARGSLTGLLEMPDDLTFQLFVAFDEQHRFFVELNGFA